ncbi:MAG: alpha/beta fold hydrolase [Steroidobacteraceae bacterium]
MNLEPGYADAKLITDEVLTRYHDLLLAPGVRGAVLQRMAQTILSDPVPILQRVRAPTLLVWGQRDAMIPFRNAADYLRWLPDARLVALPDVGHLPHEEAPQQALTRVREFLR